MGTVRKWFYRLVVHATQSSGAWAFYLLVWPVTTAFFLLFPHRVAIGVRFYRQLFPDKSWAYHVLSTWRQYHNFSRLFLDRVMLHQSVPVEHSSDGWEHLEAAIDKGTGGIILMSHMGTWEAAATIMKKKDPKMRLLLYMGKKHKEQIGGFIKNGLSRSGIRIIAVDAEGDSTLDIIEGIHFLRSGGLISLTGDRPWSGQERTLSVRFLNHEAQVLEAPHMIALLSGAPIFIFFSFRTRKKCYHTAVSKPIFVKAAARKDRRKVIESSAQQYADHLEQMLRKHPFEWYNFGPFLGKRL